MVIQLFENLFLHLCFSQTDSGNDSNNFSDGLYGLLFLVAPFGDTILWLLLVTLISCSFWWLLLVALFCGSFWWHFFLAPFGGSSWWHYFLAPFGGTILRLLLVTPFEVIPLFELFLFWELEWDWGLSRAFLSSEFVIVEFHIPICGVLLKIGQSSCNQ